MSLDERDYMRERPLDYGSRLWDTEQEQRIWRLMQELSRLLQQRAVSGPAPQRQPRRPQPRPRQPVAA